MLSAVRDSRLRRVVLGYLLVSAVLVAGAVALWFLPVAGAALIATALALLVPPARAHVDVVRRHDHLGSRHAVQTARLRQLERDRDATRRGTAFPVRLVEQVMAENLLSIAYQPVIDLESGTVVGVEALTRIRTRPYRPPDQWFAGARECGLGVDLELVAIEAALDDLSSLPEPLFLAVNASPFTLAAPGLVRSLADADPSRVVIEVSEHAAVDDYALLEEAMRTLRADGLRLVIDDTGAGHAGLRHFVGLRPDGIKLDRSLTARLPGDPLARALSGALNTFAAEVGASVVAEGVETAAQESALRTIGVPMAQGYRLGSPGPLNETLARVSGMNRRN